MNKTLLKIIKSREDISDYLFHFTNGKNARDTLEKITKEKCLRDVNNRGVICFTEAPLLSLTNMFKLFEQFENPMYAPFGIALKKKVLFDLGARNVIYGLADEKRYLHNSIKWRFEEYEPSRKDFAWLREWRVPLKTIQLTIDNSFVITKTKKDLHKLTFNEDNLLDVKFDGCVSDGQFWGSATGVAGRSFKGISVEDIDELNAMSKLDVEKLIEKQDRNDTEEIGLGGFVV